MVETRRRRPRAGAVIYLVLVVGGGAVVGVLSHEHVVRPSTSGPIYTAVVLVGFLVYVWRGSR